MTPEELAYIAGFIDGEGCIGVYQWAGPRGHKQDFVVVHIMNTNKQVLEWMAGKVGHGHVIKKRNPTARHRQAWQYRLTSRQVDKLLRQILPYLRVKRKEAVLALQALKMPSWSARTEREEERYQWLMKKSKELKRIQTLS